MSLHPLFDQHPIPVSFRCLESTGFEHTTTVVSIFPNGFVITSPRILPAGATISLRMRVPPRKPGGIFSETRCKARVVGEQNLKDGALAYKVELDEPLPSKETPGSQSATSSPVMTVTRK